MSPDNRSTDEGLSTRTDLPAEQVETRSRVTARSSRPRKPRTLWVAGGIVVLTAAVVSTMLILTGNGSVITNHIGLGPKRAPFTFTLGKVRSTTLGSKHKKATPEVAAAVQRTLSDVYGGLFLDPHAWSKGPPGDTWSNDFTDKAAAEAGKDPNSLGLGQLTGQVSGMTVESSSLDVRVLLDPHSNPTAAIGHVEFVAVATLENGQRTQITRSADYLMEEVDGKWLVAGFPRTVTDAQPATPSPSPSGSGGSS